jgi:hypothetical protein
MAFFGSVMSRMSTSVPSSLATMTAYALLPASQAKTLLDLVGGLLALDVGREVADALY